MLCFQQQADPILLWSGRNHALVPLSVSHCATIVVGHAALVGLLLAPVLRRLHGLALAFWFAHHVTGALWSETGRHGGKCVMTGAVHLELKSDFSLPPGQH